MSRAAATIPAARPNLGPREYEALRAFIYSQAGIDLGSGKQTLVYSRLIGRVEAMGVAGFGEYAQLIQQPGHDVERQTAVDLLSTNETYFNREPEHFRVLQDHASRVAARRGVVHAWSAACSSGEEAYTMAMMLQSLVDGGLSLAWELTGSDISMRMLELARRGVYPEIRVSQLPTAMLTRYCLRGQGPAQGTVRVEQALRQRVRWQQINLIEPLPAIGPFDAIFLRNVLIYFDRPTKQRVISALAERLRGDGLLVVGMSDGVQGLTGGLRMISHGVYTPAGT